MEFRNPQFNAAGGIDCEVNHPVYGWMPYTAAADDASSAGRELYAAIVDAGGIAPHVPDPAQQEAERIAAIKAEAGRRIVAIYPEWKQRNMTAEAAALIRYEAAGTITAEQSARLDALEPSWAWIASVRAASDQAESDGKTVDQIEWPAP